MHGSLMMQYDQRILDDKQSFDHSTILSNQLGQSWQKTFKTIDTTRTNVMIMVCTPHVDTKQR